MSGKKRISAAERLERKKARSRKRTLIALSVTAAVIVAVLAIVFVFRLANHKYEELTGSTWNTLSAVDASGDEVDLREVYGIRYSNYRGGLAFNEDKTFRIWLYPGEPDPETNEGVYETDGEIIYVTYGNGEKSEFRINRSSAGIDTITAEYDGYTISFSRDFPQE